MATFNDHYDLTGASHADDMESVWDPSTGKYKQVKYSDANAPKLPSGIAQTDYNKGAYSAAYDMSGSNDVKAKLNDQLKAVAARSAPQAKAAQFGAGAYMGAAKVGPVSTYGGATIDSTDTDAVRAQQMAALAKLQATASGKGPMYGSQQLQANLAQQKAAQTAAAASGPGAGNFASAARHLGQQQAAASQQAAQTGAIMDKQEQLAAQQQYSSLLGSMRSGDLNQESSQAALMQQAGLANASAQNQAALAQAGFNQGASQFNAQTAQQQYALNQQTDLANMQAKLQQMGLDDQAFAGYATMYGGQIGKDQANKQAAWSFLAGNAMGDARNKFEQDQIDSQKAAAYAAAASSAAGTFTKSQDEKDKEGEAAAEKGGYTYDPWALDGGASTSDRRAKRNIRDGSDALAKFYDQLIGGGR